MLPSVCLAFPNLSTAPQPPLSWVLLASASPESLPLLIAKKVTLSPSHRDRMKIRMGVLLLPLGCNIQEDFKKQSKTKQTIPAPQRLSSWEAEMEARVGQ
jgi:hypothetical protein